VEYGLGPLFASLGGIVVSNLFATDDQFTNGRPCDPLLQRVDEVAESSLTLAAR
jgi:hypothetical protein